MTSLIRRAVAVATFAAAMLGMTACSGDVTGTAAPTTTATPPSPLASVQPCSLITLDDQAKLGLDPGKPDNTAKSRGCLWLKHGSYTVGIYLDGSQPIDAVGTDGASSVTLQSHDAVQTTDSGFGCDVQIAISKTASVDVAISNNDCELAKTYAGLIESRLPAQQK